jgi:hypothetical protein
LTCSWADAEGAASANSATAMTTVFIEVTFLLRPSLSAKSFA